MGTEFAEEQGRPKSGPIDAAVGTAGGKARGVGSLVDDAAGVVGAQRAILQKERGVKRGIGQGNAGAKGRLGGKLFFHQFFDGVVENAVARADGGLSRPAGQLSEPAGLPVRAIRQTDSGREGFVVGGSETFGNTGITGKHQAKREIGVVGRVFAARLRGASETEVARAVSGEFARILRGGLSRAKSLQTIAVVRIRSVELPAQAVIQGYVGLDLPTILREQIQRGIAVIFTLRGALRVTGGLTQKIVRVG